MQQVAPSLLGLCCPGLPRLLQQQLVLCSSVAQQLHSQWMPGQSAPQAVVQQQQQRSMSSSSSNSSSSDDNSSCSASTRRRARGFAAHRARLPRVRKYGPELRDRDPAAFERMRLLLGYYDLPANAAKPRPPPPSHVTINNLQALRFTRDVDPYYKLALLSYRSKLENLELLQTLAKTRTFLQQLSAPPDFVPANLEALSSATPAAATAAAAPAAAEQQQQQQQDGADTK